MKFLFILFLFIFAFPVTYTYAEIKGQVLIINQVRGEECCDKGNIENLKAQVDNHIKYKVPAIFVLRYDALINEEYTDYLKKVSTDYPNLIQLGILLEVIPILTDHAGVEYDSSDDRWYDAKKIYSIGYSDEDNKKIADYIFGKYKSIFQESPQVSSSWMIDTNLLNYISQKYGIKIHQITREQWGTDSYTLYGGPPHYPYPASENWAFMPDYGREDAPLIVRQTVTDPLYNYGDKTSSFTSQPNDFSINKSYEYFNLLIRQTLFEQVGNGFALIGLENSMDSKYQRMYTNQIIQLKEFEKKGLITFPDVSSVFDFWKKQRITVYGGKDLIDSKQRNAYWITTPEYRIRIRQDGNKIFISDLRLYDRNFEDPYLAKIAQREGYWIVPFLLDGSLTKPETKKTFFSQPMPENNFSTVEHDFNETSNLINLPKISVNEHLKFMYENGNLVLPYKTEENKDIKIIFSDSNIIFQGFSIDDFNYIKNKNIKTPVEYESYGNSFSLFWNVEDNKLLEMKLNCKSDECEASFNTNHQFLQSAFNTSYNLLYPEPVNHPISKKRSVLYVHNKYAIYGRNPSRIIIIPYDKYGNVTSLNENNIVINADHELTHEFLTQDKRYYIDFYSNRPGSFKVNLLLDKGVEIEQEIIFAPNCKNELKSCLLNPRYIWWYINTIFGDKKRQVIYGE